MSISISIIRIENFRSIKEMQLNLHQANVLIGQNNSGKSNFLRAMGIALGSIIDVSSEDVFISESDGLNQDKSAIVDLVIIPVNDAGGRIPSFDDFWVSAITDKWIVTDETSGDYCAIRTEIKYKE